MPRKRKTQPGDGGAYSNRTDLTQPVRTPVNLPYGENQALAQSQQQAPLPQTPDLHNQAMAAAQQHNFQPVALNAPTQRPFEPTTHGLPVGPGGGPEVMRQTRPNSSLRLKQLAMATGDTALADMAARLEQYGL